MQSNLKWYHHITRELWREISRELDCDKACVVTMMLKNAIYDSTELGKDKIRKDRHQNQTQYDDYITLDLLGELSDS